MKTHTHIFVCYILILISQIASASDRLAEFEEVSGINSNNKFIEISYFYGSGDLLVYLTDQEKLSIAPIKITEMDAKLLVDKAAKFFAQHKSYVDLKIKDMKAVVKKDLRTGRYYYAVELLNTAEREVGSALTPEQVVFSSDMEICPAKTFNGDKARLVEDSYRRGMQQIEKDK